MRRERKSYFINKAAHLMVRGLIALNRVSALGVVWDLGYLRAAISPTC